MLVPVQRSPGQHPTQPHSAAGRGGRGRGGEPGEAPRVTEGVVNNPKDSSGGKADWVGCSAPLLLPQPPPAPNESSETLGRGRRKKMKSFPARCHPVLPPVEGEGGNKEVVRLPLSQHAQENQLKTFGLLKKQGEWPGRKRNLENICGCRHFLCICSLQNLKLIIVLLFCRSGCSKVERYSTFSKRRRVNQVLTLSHPNNTCLNV